MWWPVVALVVGALGAVWWVVQRSRRVRNVSSFRVSATLPSAVAARTAYKPPARAVASSGDSDRSPFFRAGAARLASPLPSPGPAVAKQLTYSMLDAASSTSDTLTSFAKPAPPFAAPTSPIVVPARQPEMALREAVTPVVAAAVTQARREAEGRKRLERQPSSVSVLKKLRSGSVSGAQEGAFETAPRGGFLPEAARKKRTRKAGDPAADDAKAAEGKRGRNKLESSTGTKRPSAAATVKMIASAGADAANDDQKRRRQRPATASPLTLVEVVPAELSTARTRAPSASPSAAASPSKRRSQPSTPVQPAAAAAADAMPLLSPEILLGLDTGKYRVGFSGSTAPIAQDKRFVAVAFEGPRKPIVDDEPALEERRLKGVLDEANLDKVKAPPVREASLELSRPPSMATPR